MDRLQMEVEEHRRQMDADRRLLAQRQAELDERSEALIGTTTRPAFAPRRSNAGRTRSSACAAIEHRELAERRQQAGDEQAAFEAQRLAWESQRGEQQARVAEEQQRLIDEAERLEHARRRSSRSASDWERERTEMAEAAEPVARIEVSAYAHQQPRSLRRGSRPRTRRPTNRTTRSSPGCVPCRCCGTANPRTSRNPRSLRPRGSDSAPTHRESVAAALWSGEQANAVADEGADDFPLAARPRAHADDEGEGVVFRTT